MAVNPARRQRKLEKKRCQKKAEKRMLARGRSQGLAARLNEVSRSRVLHCQIADTVWTAGIGHVWISRDLRGGQVAVAVFLLDVYCLGVKNVIGGIWSRPQYFARQQQFLEKRSVEPVSLECARKLVEGAVAYAARADIEPHPDYRRFAVIFGNADASACTREFTYGLDGKPHFVQGPHDSPERCREIIFKLANRYGDDGYRYLMQVLPGDEWTDLLPSGAQVDLADSSEDEERDADDGSDPQP